MCDREKADYYDVTLDFEKGSGEKIGRSYAQAILKACPDYRSMLEQCLILTAEMFRCFTEERLILMK